MTRNGSPPLVLVYEAISGGAWPLGELPRGLGDEGMAMLRAALEDFGAAGARTRTALDSRLRGTLTCAGEVVDAEPGGGLPPPALEGCDAALVIAPETGGMLARLSADVLAAGVRLLGSSPGGAALAGDKWACHSRLEGAGLPVPSTRRVPLDGVAAAARALGLPVVLKPLDGVGCEGVCLLEREGELDRALGVLGTAAPGGQALVQRYVPGQAASVSLLVAGGAARALTLNGQRVRPGIPFAYEGGAVPLCHPLAGRALDAAEAAARLLPGLAGYVGVDLVLGADGAWVIEVNPRLTTAYVGVRRVLPLNLARAICRACREGVLPGPVQPTGRVEFSRGGATW
jgi:predicted ATP-grasp superfamily ATP-dependent carboligase